MHEVFDNPLSRSIWQTRYRWTAGGLAGDHSVDDSWRRVAAALAAAEPRRQRRWRSRFHALLQGFRFLPGGRILAGAGTGADVTLFNCFVIGAVEDSADGIAAALDEAAVTMQQGGGIGCDFSTLRPQGTPATGSGGAAPGPVGCMHRLDALCTELLSDASRRGAMMATLRCDHPDIETFVDAKRDPLALRNFNLSVLVSDAFLAAVRSGQRWPLLFPRAVAGGGDALARPAPRQLSARSLWQRIMRAAYDTAEPGVLFIDRINRRNNLGYRERISATNPCGEIPLPPYGACNLGSLNLVCFVRAPFSARAELDLEALAAATATAVRMLDDVVSVSRFPLPRQARQAQNTRRIGIGITGLADALILLGLHYASDAARSLAARAMACISHAAYRASMALAAERGPFPYFVAEPYLEAPFVRALPADIRDGIARVGIRNSHLTAIAPAGTISLLANAVSSGIEPIVGLEGRRRVRTADGRTEWHPVTDYAWRRWRALHASGPLPAALVSAAEVSPRDQLAMQAALQPFVDNAISKTLSVPGDYPFSAFASIYDQADRLGLKGCTVFRPNPILSGVLEPAAENRSSVRDRRCCGREQEI